MATYRNVPADIFNRAHTRLSVITLACCRVRGIEMIKPSAAKVAYAILDDMPGAEIAEFVGTFESAALSRAMRRVEDYLDAHLS